MTFGITPLPAAGFVLDEAVPWGRNRVEYAAFFDLAELAPATRVLDCAGGPSSFTAEMSALGFPVVAADPLYRLTRAEIKLRIELGREQVMAAVRAGRDRFVWDAYGTPEGLEATRLSAMKLFLADYEAGQAAGRYIAAGLPALPFGDRAFDLALASHFLFLYGARFDRAFHLAGLRELCRVAREVRIFPLVDLAGRRSAHLEPALAMLAAAGLTAELAEVGYQFQKGGNQMLRIRRDAS